MRALILAAILSLAALPALAQQADPATAFAKEWGTLQAADTLAASSHEHIAELAQKLVSDYQAKVRDLAKAQSDNAALESRLSTAMDWLKQAQDK